MNTMKQSKLNAFVVNLYTAIDKSILAFIAYLAITVFAILGTAFSLNVYNHPVMNIEKFSNTPFEFQAKLMNLDLQTRWHMTGIAYGSAFVFIIVLALFFVTMWATNHDDN